jgi:acyl-CoA thioester hydrolase
MPAYADSPEESPVLHVRVRFAETDQMGIAHHAVYPVWMEAGRVQWLRSHGLSYRSIEESGVSLAVSGLELRYRRAARFDDLIAVHTHLRVARSRLLRFDYVLVRAGDDGPLATGTSVHVPTDPRGRAVRLPETWLAPIAALIEPAA